MTTNAHATNFVLRVGYAVAGMSVALAPSHALAQFAKPSSVEALSKSIAPMSADVLALVDKLNSPELKVRDDATARLRTSGEASLAVLERILTSSPLSPEQHARLTSIAKEQFTRTPRAALGVQFDDAGARSSDGVPIVRTIDGFDSCRVLKGGDVMYAMSGVRVTSLDDARKIITSHDPGERMTIQLFRNGEPLIVRVGLGNFADLDGRPDRRVGGGGFGIQGNRNFRGTDVTDAAWELRLARIMGDDASKPNPIDPGVSHNEYAALEVEVEHAADTHEKRGAVKTIARQDQGDQADAGEHGIQAGGGASGKVGLDASAEFAAVGRLPAKSEAALQAERTQLQLELNNINMLLMQQQQLQPQQLDPKKRQNIIQQTVRIRTRLMEIDSQLAKEKMLRMPQPPRP